jgi:hypothetical protein
MASPNGDDISIIGLKKYIAIHGLLQIWRTRKSN